MSKNNPKKAEKAKARRKDYQYKRNVARNEKFGTREARLVAGEGILPASKKHGKQEPKRYFVEEDSSNG